GRRYDLVTGVPPCALPIYLRKAAVAADRPPFEDLYREYLGRIYAYVRAQVGTSADAEDIAAQVFMNAYQGYERFEPRNTTPAARPEERRVGKGGSTRSAGR